MFTSCCPSGVNYVEKNYPEMKGHISTTSSPQQCFGAIAKTYLAEKMEIDPKKMRVISIMPCTAKKEEAKRPEFIHDSRPDVDAVLTTREFARLMKREDLDLTDLEPSNFDNLWMGKYSGAAVLFGTTGGVMEAAVRTVHKIVTGKELAQVEFSDVRGLEKTRGAEVYLGDEIGTIRLAMVQTLKAAGLLLEAVKSGKEAYHFVEVMACQGGVYGRRRTA